MQLTPLIIIFFYRSVFILKIKRMDDSADNIVGNNGNVYYVDDPNNVNINYDVVNGKNNYQKNGIPPYEDMHIFAELTATRKARTVLVTTDGRTKNDGNDDIVHVNFIGNDQFKGNKEDSNPNYLNFTTNYYDGSTGDDIIYESFGMTNIKASMNSSFIPQVNIQFVDIRGLSFFNQKDSPYRILFDFPPPIFNLVIKGYYGKSLTYRLHLVKYTSEFKSENGNFVIDAQFIAMTYAPLTDILFRYIINFPLMNQKPLDDTTNVDNNITSISIAESNTIGNTSTTIPPKNTNELILKLKNLYSAISIKMKTDDDIIDYNELLKKLSKTNELIKILNNYANEIGKDEGIVYLMTKELITSKYANSLESTPYDTYVSFELSKTSPESSTPISYNIDRIGDLNDYNGIIKNLSVEGIPETSKIRKKLIMSYVLTPNNNKDNEETLKKRENKLKNILKEYKNNLLSTAENVGYTRQYSDITISDPDTFINNYNVSNNKNNVDNTTKYVFIDITDFYMKLYKDKFNITESLTELTHIIEKKINDMVLTELGMKLTIYNVFKIILDDVDTFFNIIRKTSIEAEKDHHNIAKNKTLILNGQLADTGDENEKIYAFPLVINKNKVCGGFTEERISPLDISNSLNNDPFPEMILVDEFINTFLTQKNLDYLSSMKSQQNADGSFKWIPISPIDSLLASKNTKTPYFGIDTTDGGSTFTPINISKDDRLTQVLKIVLKRFYVLTQSLIQTNFYYHGEKEEDKTLRDAYIKLYSTSEANNLAMSIIEIKYANSIKTIANDWTKNIDNENGFYEYVKKNIPDLYSFTENDRKFFTVSKDIDAYVDKKNDDYVGIAIYDETIIERKNKENSNNPIDLFQNNIEQGWWTKLVEDDIPENLFSFTQENVLYVKDIYIKSKGKSDSNSQEYKAGVPIKTRFLGNFKNEAGFNWKTVKDTISGELNAIIFTSENKVSLVTNNKILSVMQDKPEVIKKLLENGNNYFVDKNGLLEGDYRIGDNKLDGFENVVNAWSYELSEHDNEDEFINVITGDTELSALIFLSNFGWTLGPFNLYDENLKGFLFDAAGAIDVPKYLPLYIGALIAAKKDKWVNKIIDFFSYGNAGGKLQSSGLFIFADIHDFNEHLSENDKETFLNYWKNWYDKKYKYISVNINELIKEVNTLIINDDNIKKEAAYYELLSDDYFISTVGEFLDRTTIINFSEITFQQRKKYPTGYYSLERLNNSEQYKEINNSYFKSFFSKLKQAIQKNLDKLSDEKLSNEKLKGDDDILTQTYYSFKNINDKWLSSPIYSDIDGYPFNEPNKKLIDSFAFVDRAMNPIGDTIINPEMLIDLFHDHNVTVFSVLSQLLSTNGFNFFPIQNFMMHDRNSWADSFRINTNIDTETHSAFVCMFIGGTSNYPTGIGRTNNGFKDDCIVDITTTNAIDFHTKTKNSEDEDDEDDDCTNTEDDNQVVGNTSFSKNYRNVRAFRVKFGEQNQSMFKDIKIESKEYPETNESIQILSRIAGDNKKQAPIPKGQNLYNLYENRAYKATVTGLGNAMIQPTQYFQLDNVPIFNGAYLILNVEHNITPNTMITSFSGTKILKFPIPRVKNSSALFDIEAGDSEYTSISDMSASGFISNVTSNYNPSEAKYNSMYKINIV